MGDPKFPSRKYDTPSHPWQGERIKAEAELVTNFGLKNKRELWKAESLVRRFRDQSKNLQARVRQNDEQAKLEASYLLVKCARMGLLPMDGATLDDVLALSPESVLGRRLQTIVYRKGLATTPGQARQFIVHGHVAIDNRKINIPGYIVKRGEEDRISFNPHSPIANELHPLRQTKKEGRPEREREETEEERAERLKVPKKVLKEIEAVQDVTDEGASEDLPEEPTEEPEA